MSRPHAHRTSPSKPPLRYPGSSASDSTTGQEVRLVTNAYCITTDPKEKTIYEYSVQVCMSEGHRDIPAKVLNRNFVSRTIRKILMIDLVPQLLGNDSSKSTIVIDSNLESIYSTAIFNLTCPKTRDSVPTSNGITFKSIIVKSDLINRLHVDIIIEFSRTVVLTPREPVLLTSIMHHKPLLTMLRYGSVYYKYLEEMRTDYTNDRRLDLISQHTMGLSMSGIRTTTSNQNLVVINCAHSYITQLYHLIDLLATFIMSRPVEPIRLIHDRPLMSNSHLVPEICSTNGREEWFKTFSSLLDGFKCRTDIMGERLLLRFDLTEESASNQLMSDSATSEPITVEEYYKRIGIHLNYPNLPCLKSRSHTHPFCPLEMCTLLSGQKVPIFRLSQAARNQLTNYNKPKPDVSKTSSVRARNELSMINQSMFDALGIKISQQPVEASGSTLAKPILQYLGKEYEPQRDYWESGTFYQAMHLIGNWCVVNTVEIDPDLEYRFFVDFSQFCKRFGFNMGEPFFINKSKEELLDNGINRLIEECQRLTKMKLKFIMFVIDSSSTNLNRLIHLTFDEHLSVTATCLRIDSILNFRQHRSIFRTLVHKLNARLGGTNFTYNSKTLAKLSLKLDDLMIIGLDVTHPDNELSGVSIVGCAYTYSNDLFRHRSLVWPQAARTEIIDKIDVLSRRLLHEYHAENRGRLPKQIIVYRDGVSHEEFKRVRSHEITEFQRILDEVSIEAKHDKPVLSYIIAQKRHSMRFYQVSNDVGISNPPSGTLIDQDIVSNNGREFYLYSNTSPQATARPLHYHVLLNGLGIENLQKLTYFMCFNFGKCSGTLSMPSSLRYAHNAAYDARNRVIASREFSENRFYPSKFFC